MSEVIVIPSQTAALTNTNDARAHETVVYKCAGISGAETIPINVLIGSAFQPAIDYNTGLAMAFSVTNTAVELVGDYYEFVKGITASATTVTASPRRRING